MKKSSRFSIWQCSAILLILHLSFCDSASASEVSQEKFLTGVFVGANQQILTFPNASSPSGQAGLNGYGYMIGAFLSSPESHVLGAEIDSEIYSNSIGTTSGAGFSANIWGYGLSGRALLNINFSLFRDMEQISLGLGAKNLGFYVEIMEPKTFSCPYHWHSGEEELFVVIEGEATVRCNGEFKIVKPGDLVYYGTGPESVHHMYNHTEKPFKYFTISNQVHDEICEYPDSKKTNVRGEVKQQGVKVDYWKDEEDPSKYWPKEKL